MATIRLDNPQKPYPKGWYNTGKIEYFSASQIKIKSGMAGRSDDDLINIDVASDITVDITASGANGLDAGTEAISTRLYIWVILNPASGVVAGLLSLSATAPTMPSGYTRKFLHGVALFNNGSGNIDEFYHDPGERTVVLVNPYTVASNQTNTTFVARDCSNIVPVATGRAAIVNILTEFVTGSATSYTNAGGSSNATGVVCATVTSSAAANSVDRTIPIDASGNIKSRMNATTSKHSIYCYGYTY